MVARIRRTKKKTVSTPRIKKAAAHKADGIIYSSAEVANFHKTLVGNPVVNSFHLMSAEEEKNYKSGKYKNKKCEINGFQFDSIMEAKYYIYLLEQKALGFIQDFAMQVKYTLMDKYRDNFTGKIVRPIEYLADFVVKKADGTIEAIDVKGKETDVFKIKQKLFGSRYPNVRLVCYQWSNKYGNRWIELEELKKLRKEDKKAKSKKKKA